MRVVPRGWSNERWICSIRGHVAPAARAERLGPGDGQLGLDQPDGTRLARCLRCDDWVEVEPPSAADAEFEVVPPLDQLGPHELPRRGKSLEDAILLRLIAIERGFHGVLFTVLAVVLIVVRLDLGRIQRWAHSLQVDLSSTIDNTGTSGHSRLARELTRCRTWARARSPSCSSPPWPTRWSRAPRRSACGTRSAGPST